MELGKIGPEEVNAALRKRQPLRVFISHTPEYRAILNAIQRCSNPNNESYADYGARGISVCKQWSDDPKSFVDYMGKRPSDKHSIDRIDNDGNYEPGNVRWNTPTGQARNTGRVIMDMVTARAIRQRYLEGATRKKIMDEFGVNWFMVYNIVENRTWKEEVVA